MPPQKKSASGSQQDKSQITTQGMGSEKKCLVCGKPIKEIVYFPVAFEKGEIQPQYVRKEFPFCSHECLEQVRVFYLAKRKNNL